MYKQDLAKNNVQCLIYHKTQVKQSKPNLPTQILPIIFR